MEVPSQTSSKKRKREPSVDARITYHTPSKTFERLFQEHSLDDVKRVVRHKLGLADDLDIQLAQIRGNSSIVLEDDDDFEAFRVALEANPLVDMRVSVVPRDGAPLPTPLAPNPTTSFILPEMPPPTQKGRRKNALLQQASVRATESKSGATTTISTSRDAHSGLDKAISPAQTPVPPPPSVQTLTEHQQPKASKLKLKPNKKVHLISSPSSDESIKPPLKDMVNSVPFLQPFASETRENVPERNGQHRVEPEPEKEEESANLLQVMQIIKSVCTVRHTPQEILAAFNNKKSNRRPIPNAVVQPPPAQKSKSPNKAPPTLVATPIEGRLTLQAPEIPVNPPCHVCPICGEKCHPPYPCPSLASKGPELAQRVQELRIEGETDLIRFIEDHQLNKRNPEMLGAVTRKQEIFNPLALELQSSGLLSPPSIVDSYRSEITVQSPGEGSSSPPSPAHARCDDGHGENDAAEPLLELSAKNIAASLVSPSPTPIPERPPAEIDELSNECAKTQSENSADDEWHVVPSVSSQARVKSSESYRSESSSDSPSTKDMPSPNSRQITLAAPPIVQSASLIRPRFKSTFPPLSPTPAAIDLSLEVPELPVIETLKSSILQDMSIEPGEIRQPQDEELEPTQIVANTSTPCSPLPRQPRPSQSLPRLSIIPRRLPRTVTQLLLPKSTSRFTPTMPDPARDDNKDKDTTSSDDDSSDGDNQNSRKIPANQQAGSQPVFRRRRNVLASF